MLKGLKFTQAIGRYVSKIFTTKRLCFSLAKVFIFHKEEDRRPDFTCYLSLCLKSFSEVLVFCFSMILMLSWPSVNLCQSQQAARNTTWSLKQHLAEHCGSWLWDELSCWNHKDFLNHWQTHKSLRSKLVFEFPLINLICHLEPSCLRIKIRTNPCCLSVWRQSYPLSMFIAHFFACLINAVVHIFPNCLN